MQQHPTALPRRRLLPPRREPQQRRPLAAGAQRAARRPSGRRRPPLLQPPARAACWARRRPQGLPASAARALHARHNSPTFLTCHPPSRYTNITLPSRRQARPADGQRRRCARLAGPVSAGGLGCTAIIPARMPRPQRRWSTTTRAPAPRPAPKAAIARCMLLGGIPSIAGSQLSSEAVIGAVVALKKRGGLQMPRRQPASLPACNPCCTYQLHCELQDRSPVCRRLDRRHLPVCRAGPPPAPPSYLAS